ncbi:hypothetical protein BDV96DRAFT_652710 [Lophiotrema nucula]|uniref:Rhodopsin domain-containing protein n=1 Tax=Lophiotrema nucula TaxID=690887 RepID=A0A6A5YQX8_9PLEO|nr:hypothetical protein BDV96DRAFT_652710 [Lophiotrema nucula]
MSQYTSYTIPHDENHNKGPALEAVNLVSFILAFLMVTARVLYRYFKIKATAWDDYMIILATVAAAVNTAFIMKYVEYGGGRHTVYLKMKAVDVAKWSTIAQLPFIISTTLTKVSIALMILRISNSKKLKWAMAPLVTVVVCVNLAGIVILAARCKPFESNWNYAIPKPKCWPRTVLKNQNYLQGIVSIVSDLVYTVLPIFVVWGLNITRRQKIAISGLIGLGLLATACSIARLVLYETYTNWTDSTYGLSDLQIWTALEQNLGIVAASLPTLRVFFKELGQSLRSSAGSIFGAITARSRGSLSERLGSKESASSLEKGIDWHNGDRNTSEKSPKTQVASHPLEQEMDLKYLGGSLEMQGQRESR